MDAELATAHPVEPGEVAGDGVRSAHVALADHLDLPPCPMSMAAPLGVGGVSIHAAVLGMDVELDAPSSARHAEVDLDPAPVRSGDRRLFDDRHAEPPEGGAQDHLGV